MNRFQANMKRIYVTPEWQGPLKNPFKGWALFPANRNGFQDGSDVFSGYDPQVLEAGGLGYLRFNWADLNPERNVYDFSKIDHFIMCAAKQGWQVGFGAPTPAASTSNRETLLPSYLFEEGIKYECSTVENNHTGEQFMQKHPIWDDPVYLNYCKEFVLKLAEKYDGNENIAFINPLTYGNWGEWHTQFLGNSKDLTFEQAKKHVKLWAEAFHKTQIIIPINHHMPEMVAQWACDEYGWGMSRWGLIYLPDDHFSASYCLNTAPAIGEFYTDYKRTKDWGAWSSEKLTQIIEEGHLTWMELAYGSEANEIFKEERHLMKKLQNRLGYHFVVKSAAQYFESNEDGEYEFGLVVENKGVAPIYYNCYLVAALLDQEGKVTKKHLTNINPRKWWGNSHSAFRFRLPFDDTDGQLAVGLFTNPELNNPDIAFANQQLLNRWLKLG